MGAATHLPLRRQLTLPIFGLGRWLAMIVVMSPSALRCVFAADCRDFSNTKWQHADNYNAKCFGVLKQGCRGDNWNADASPVDAAILVCGL